MNKYILCGLAGLVLSCGSTADKKHSDDKSNGHVNNQNPAVYSLRFNPPAGASYYYNITNESDIELEVDGKEVNNLSSRM